MNSSSKRSKRPPAGEPARKVPHIRERIGEYLAEHPGAAGPEIARALGLTHQRIYQALRRYGIRLRPS